MGNLEKGKSVVMIGKEKNSTQSVNHSAQNETSNHQPVDKMMVKWIRDLFTKFMISTSSEMKYFNLTRHRKME
ncbi:CLUMA_CG014796, isoform A [Clunio marinus]|uniref:CLUMA_CG014796, isoform A n=1 Tax=Clunio marinus TaxID=568069 RepID=A0A1J1IRS1_9DIPT|nr:CLUMA_CG014796, isoform A [Clunio marinus]